MALCPPPGSTCFYCDREFDSEVAGRVQTRDHVVPRSLKKYSEAEGGLGRLNKVYACQRCNNMKANNMPVGLRRRAKQLEKDAALLRQIADRAEAIIKERKLL